MTTYFEIWSANLKFQFSDKDIFFRWISLESVAKTVIIDKFEEEKFFKIKKNLKLTHKQNY